jgi:hypothetical protein
LAVLAEGGALGLFGFGWFGVFGDFGGFGGFGGFGVFGWAWDFGDLEHVGFEYKVHFRSVSVGFGYFSITFRVTFWILRTPMCPEGLGYRIF